MSASSAGLPRGIDHIGMTVPDLEAAARFLTEAFGAVALYDNVTEDDPQQGPDAEETLGLPPGTSVQHMRMMRLGNGPSIELFEMRSPAPRQKAAIASDYGLQHFAVYVDDVDAAVARFEAAGGHVLTAPKELLGIEKGAGNAFCYGRTPWGGLVELISWPGEAPWERTAPAPRYRPPPRD